MWSLPMKRVCLLLFLLLVVDVILRLNFFSDRTTTTTTTPTTTTTTTTITTTTAVRLDSPTPSKRKLILDWTTYFDERLENEQSLAELGCPVTYCDYTNDRSLLAVSDAVLFHWGQINEHDVPHKRDRQRFILRNYESPPGRTYVPFLESMDWTVSYRRDSDIPSYYGVVRSRKTTDPPPVPAPDKDSFARRKTIAWMVSNCSPSSKRELITAELEKFIDVDIYGGCPGGDRSLKTITNAQGFEKLSRKYKLYLSFENSVCKDYASEKLFMPLHFGMIPVVWGGAKYEDFLPANSYIDVKNFSSVQDLAAHLKKVVEDYDLYASYFQWRKDYYVQHWNVHSTYLCHVCAKLFSDQEYNVTRKVDIKTWWSLELSCPKISGPPFDLPTLRNAINALYEHKRKRK